MITSTKLGITSVIREALKLKPTYVFYGNLTVGDYFEYAGRVFVYIGGGKAIDQDGFKVRFTNEVVRPIRVKLEYDYRLLKEDGTEMILE